MIWLKIFHQCNDVDLLLGKRCVYNKETILSADLVESFVFYSESMSIKKELYDGLSLFGGNIFFQMDNIPYKLA